MRNDRCCSCLYALLQVVYPAFAWIEQFDVGLLIAVYGTGMVGKLALFLCVESTVRSWSLVGYEGQLSDEWYEEVARSRPPKDAPWYHVLVEDSDSPRYVAEKNLSRDTTDRTTGKRRLPRSPRAAA